MSIGATASAADLSSIRPLSSVEHDTAVKLVKAIRPKISKDFFMIVKDFYVCMFLNLLQKQSSFFVSEANLKQQILITITIYNRYSRLMPYMSNLNGLRGKMTDLQIIRCNLANNIIDTFLESFRKRYGNSIII